MQPLYKLQRNIFILLLWGILFLISSCKKFTEVSHPIDQLSTSLVFKNDLSAIEAIDGIYSEMMNKSSQFSSGYMTFYAGMSADELYYYTASSKDEFVTNEISPANHSLIEANFWNPCYKYIYAANLAIEGCEASTSLSDATRRRVTGEAHFIRAFCFFQLVNLFGDVPLTLSTDYHINESLRRTSSDSIYAQIIADLKTAKQNLLPGYVDGKHTRPNYFAATALLARVYLYRQDWTNAETEATEIIQSGMYNLVPSLSQVFLANSAESIWQLWPVNPSYNTWEGYQIIPATTNSTPTYLLTDNLVNSFEPGDLRKTNWVGARTFSSQIVYYPSKYKVRIGSTVTENYMVIRYAEVLLIRSEARAMQNRLSESANDLNLIRARAGLAAVIFTDQEALLLAIEHERSVELFAEWGHRWLDLKRTGRADAVLGTLKPATWQSTDALWPIPQTQILRNPSLTQNPGY
jgi:starch-binding outer membrane protein, SusD/RagB family